MNRSVILLINYHEKNTDKIFPIFLAWGRPGQDRIQKVGMERDGSNPQPQHRLRSGRRRQKGETFPLSCLYKAPAVVTQSLFDRNTNDDTICLLL